MKLQLQHLVKTVNKSFHLFFVYSRHVGCTLNAAIYSFIPCELLADLFVQLAFFLELLYVVLPA